MIDGILTKGWYIIVILLCAPALGFSEEDGGEETVDFKELTLEQQEEIQALKERLGESEERLDMVELGDLDEEEVERVGPELLVYGFFDMTFQKMFIDDKAVVDGIINENSYFMVQHFNLYLFSQLSESFSFMGELRFTFLPLGNDYSFELPGISEYDREDSLVVDPQTSEQIALGGLYIERVQLAWSPKEYFGILAGHYLTPFGIWNVDHGSPVLVTVRYPFSILHRIVPLAQTGLQLFGRFFPTETLLIDYAVTLSNGRGPIDAIQDLDENKGLGLRLRFTYEGEAVRAALGGYGYWGEFTDIKKTMSLDPFKVTQVEIAGSTEWVGSLDFFLEFFGVLLQAEFARRHVIHDIHGERSPTLGVGLQPNYNVTDFYELLSYKLPLDEWIAPWSIRPYFMHEFVDLDDSTDNGRGHAYVAGINLSPQPFLVLKLEYSLADLETGRMDIIAAQMAVSF